VRLFATRRSASSVPPGDHTDRFSWFFPLATFALVVAILRTGQDVLIPVAFSVLLAFLLTPLVVRLMRWGLPKTVAIVTTVVVAFSLIGGVGWIVTSQAFGLFRELPNYEQNIQRKIATLKQPHTPAAMSRMAGMIENLRKEIKAPEPTRESAGQAAPSETKPLPVEIHPAEPTPLEMATDIAGPVLQRLGIAGIVIVFVVAILFQREDLRDRFIRLVSAGKLNVATQAIDDAARRVSRYLGMQLVVNATYGVPIGVGLYFIGIPNALLWGLLATFLRFIPFVGPWIAAVFPLALALAVDPGWSKFFYTAALFTVMELVSNNLIEVVLYGASTGISNFALLVAAVFWTWLWGPAGLVLSTPLTVCLLVLGNHVPGFKFLSMALGSEPVLDPPDQFYQRMLSMESEDMLELASRFIVERSLPEFYDEVFLPALLMSEQDRHSGALTEKRQQFIFEASRELIEELERQEETAKLNLAPGSNPPIAPAKPVAPAVLSVPARDDADEVVALMLSHLLRRKQIAAAATVRTASSEDTAGMIRRNNVKVVVISALPPSAVSAARHMWWRLFSLCPQVSAFIGIWRHEDGAKQLGLRLRLSRGDQVVTTLGHAVDAVEKALQSGRSSEELTDASLPRPAKIAPE
jgi:predicted PurR-regulated permease PerM